MEKNTPHTKLDHVKKLAKQGKIAATMNATDGAGELGIDSLKEMTAVVLRLTMKDFYKSMTSINDHKTWQDVYKPSLLCGRTAYIKLTVKDDVLIVSFKEK